MAYDSAPSNPDIAALNARQARMRAFVEDMAERVMALTLPETYLEAERSVRAITVADRFLQRVPDQDKPETHALPDPEPGVSPVRDPFRLRLRAYGDRVIEAATFITKPVCFLECERAVRYAHRTDLMLTQLYMPPRQRQMPDASGRTGDDEDDHGAEIDEAEANRAWLERMLARFDQITADSAKNYGFWPSGATYDEGKDDPKAHIYEDAAPSEAETEPPEPFTTETLPQYLIDRLNRMAWYHGRHHGRLPDGSPFDPGGPPWLHLAVNFAGNCRPAPDEISEGPFWWIMRRRLPSDPPPKRPAPPE